MAYSPARFLAPIALLVVAVAIFATFSSYRGSDDGSSAGATPSTSTQGTPTESNSTQTREKTTSSSKGKGKTYTVEPGDVLSAIAEQTGVSLERIQELNPDVDAQSLRAGQKLKLAR